MSEPVGNSGSGKWHLPLPTVGIGTRIVAGLGVIVVVLVSALWSTRDHFLEVRNLFAGVSNNKLPGLVAAAELAQESEKLIGFAPDIMVADTDFIRADIAHSVAESRRRKSAYLKTLARLDARNRIQALDRQYEQLALALMGLIGQVDAQQRARQEMNRKYKRLARLAQSVNRSHLEALDENLGEDWTRWYHAANLATALLFSVRNLDQLPRAQNHRNRLASAMAALTGAASALPAGQNRGMAHKVTAELNDYGVGERGLLSLRVATLEAQEKIRRQLSEIGFLAAALQRQVGELFQWVKMQAVEDETTIDRQIEHVSILFIVLPGVSLLTVALIYVYIRRSVIGRLLSLERAMERNVRRDPVPIPLEGRDEITRMAGAVNYFIAEISSREVQLRDALERAEAANRAKSVFLAQMGHELRTPLNAVLGYAQLLQQTDPQQVVTTEKLRQYARIILSSGQHLLTLINDVLDSARIETGKLEMHPSRCNLPALFEEQVAIIAQRAREKGLTLDYRPLVPLPLWVALDEKRMRQVLLNLLTNAVKFTTAGKVLVEVDYRAHNGQSGELSVAVTDTGAGIAAADCERIFAPFTQVGHHHHHSDGSGLGLSISAQLVERFGGRLQVESTPGQGSRFYFTVPVSLLEERRAAPRPAATLPRDYEGRRRTIMVVEDNAQNRQFMSVALNEMRFEVIEAAHGGDALERLQQGDIPDLVITDLFMPEVGGGELLRRIREQPQWRHLPVLVATAGGEGVVVDQPAADGWLSKPVDLVELATMLQRALHLSWVYSGVKHEMLPERGELIGPEPVLARRLHRYVITGHIARIVELTESMERDDLELAPFARRMRELATGFRHGEMLALVERYLDDSSDAGETATE